MNTDKNKINKLLEYLTWERQNTLVSHNNNIVLYKKYLKKKPLDLTYQKYEKNHKSTNYYKKLKRLIDERNDLIKLFPALETVWVNNEILTHDLSLPITNKKNKKQLKKSKSPYYYYSCKKGKYHHSTTKLLQKKKQCRLLKNKKLYVVPQSYLELENVIEHNFEFVIKNHNKINNGIYILLKHIDNKKDKDIKFTYSLFKKQPIHINYTYPNDLNMTLYLAELYKYRDDNKIPRSYFYKYVTNDIEIINDLLLNNKKNLYVLLISNNNQIIFAENIKNKDIKFSLSEEINLEYDKNQNDMIITMNVQNIEEIEKNYIIEEQNKKEQNKKQDLLELFSFNTHNINGSITLENNNKSLFSSIQLIDLICYNIKNQKRFFLRDYYYYGNKSTELYNYLSTFINENKFTNTNIQNTNTYKKKIICTIILPNYYSMTYFINILSTKKSLDNLFHMNKLKSEISKLLINNNKVDREEVYIDIHNIIPNNSSKKSDIEIIEIFIDFKKMSNMAQFLLKNALNIVQKNPITISLSISCINFQHVNKKTKNQRYKDSIPIFTLKLKKIPPMNTIIPTILTVPSSYYIEEKPKKYYDKKITDEINQYISKS